MKYFRCQNPGLVGKHTLLSLFGEVYITRLKVGVQPLCSNFFIMKNVFIGFWKVDNILGVIF